MSIQRLEEECWSMTHNNQPEFYFCFAEYPGQSLEVGQVVVLGLTKTSASDLALVQVLRLHAQTWPECWQTA